jgi:hypothetical protein
VTVKIILGISLAVNLWFVSNIIRLEKFHYSTQVGLCSDQTIIKEGKVLRLYDERIMYSCLSQKQPRTSELWNLIYGLKLL